MSQIQSVYANRIALHTGKHGASATGIRTQPLLFEKSATEPKSKPN